MEITSKPHWGHAIERGVWRVFGNMDVPVIEWFTIYTDLWGE